MEPGRPREGGGSGPHGHWLLVPLALGWSLQSGAVGSPLVFVLVRLWEGTQVGP